VDGSHELATLHIQQGCIVQARCGLRRGEAAVYRALRLRRGRFTVRRTSGCAGASLALPITAAILEGVRRHDECERLREALPGEEELLFWPGRRVPSELRGSTRDAAELFVVPRTIGDVIRSSGEDELSLLRELVVLRPRLSSRTAPSVATSLCESIDRWSASPPLEPPEPERTRRLEPPPALRDDYELVAVAEPRPSEALREQSTFEPFTYAPEPRAAGASEPIYSSRRARSATLPPRVLAVLASAATLASFVLTLAVLPARPARLAPLAPEVVRWMSEAWPCAAHDPPPPTVAELVCPSR
jgi:hypothetical protein